MKIVNHEKTTRKIMGMVMGCGIEIDTWRMNASDATIITKTNIRHITQGKIFKDRWREWEEPIRLKIDYEEEKLIIDVHGSQWMSKAEEVAKEIQELFPKMDITVQLTQTMNRELNSYVCGTEQ